MVTNAMLRSFVRRLRRSGRLARGDQRGAAIFVVLMVLTILTAIGVFAARAAGMNQRLSGYSRQQTQTGYIAEYGTLMAVDELTSPKGQAYIDQMKKGTDMCRANQFIDAGADPVPCYRITKAEMQNTLDNETLGAQLVEDDGESLGDFEHRLMADFNVEMTDLYKGSPAPGSDQSGIVRGFEYMQLTLTGSGQVRPTAAGDPDGGVCSTEAEQAAAQLSGTRTFRAVIETRVQTN
ncbi:MAG: pilus assembly PilX N-terminal domain-containing protein [Myxococcota bacterium]